MNIDPLRNRREMTGIRNYGKFTMLADEFARVQFGINFGAIVS